LGLLQEARSTALPFFEDDEEEEAAGCDDEPVAEVDDVNFGCSAVDVLAKTCDH
jgi:hypothetical protein